MLGTLLNGRYRVIQMLGGGGFGQTYIAEDTQQPGDRQCVVKQFQPANREGSFLQIARRLFFNEAETLKKLGSHEQIPSLIDLFEENQEFYLVQEYIEGRPFNQELAAVHQLSEAEVVAFLKDVLQILEFVHQNSVIHRDIKPSNLIRRQQDGRFVLIDFGAVKAIQTQLMTDTGQPGYTVGIGTQGYGPSEQLMGKPRYNSDLYALGMTAIQALTGMQPSQLPTDPNTAEVIWQDQVEVSSPLAAILDKMVRYHFSQRYQTAQEVLEALEHPTELIADRTQVPLSQLSLEPPTLPTSQASRQPDTVFRSRRQPLASVVIGVMSLTITGLLVGIRQLGWIQPLELAVFDRLVQLAPSPAYDPRLLVIGVTEEDIQQQKRFPLSDRTIAQTLKILQSYQPRAIGLALLRDVPQPPGQVELAAELKAANVITITSLNHLRASLATNRASDQVGFNDLVLDPDGVVRRNLLFADAEGVTFYSFSLRLALTYLDAKQIRLQADPRDLNTLHLGKAILKPLEKDSGGYHTIDAKGYQLLLRYRGRQAAQQVSLNAVLNRQLKPDWVRDKVVLIGTTAVSGKDLFFTPYSAVEKDAPRLAGVNLYAHTTSQILSAALDNQLTFGFWPDWVEIVWITGWALLGGSMAGSIRYPLLLGLSGTGLLAVLGGVSGGLFIQGMWTPVALPAIAAIATGGAIITYRAYWLG